MMKLYELAADYRKVDDLLMASIEARINGDDAAADDIDVWRDTIESIGGTMEMKLCNIARLVREKQAEADAIKAEKERIAKRQKAAENAAEHLRAYMAFAMNSTGIEKAKDETVSVSFNAGRPKVAVRDLAALQEIPDVWKPYKFEETNLDKTAIKQMLEGGTAVPGVELITEKVLSIR